MLVARLSDSLMGSTESDTGTGKDRDLCLAVVKHLVKSLT